MPEIQNVAEDYRDVNFIRMIVNNAKSDEKKPKTNRFYMRRGVEYYEGIQAIRFKRRMAIGENGALEEIPNLPNNIIMDNQYERLVVQKSNYIVGKEPTFFSDDKTYNSLLEETFDKFFDRTLLYTAQDCLNCGIGWIMPYYEEDSADLKFKKYDPLEIIPVWADKDHSKLDFAIRSYNVVVYERGMEKKQKYVDVFHPYGRISYKVNGNDYELMADEGYINILNESGEISEMLNWGGKVPLVAFKYNKEEIPLIKKVKTLQDALNIMLSELQDNMQDNSRNTILVLVNYDGEDLADFRHNLNKYGAVKLRDTGEGSGDLRTLQVEVNIDNYDRTIENLKRDIIENGKGYDTKDLNAGTPNEMNIKSMYSDIDLDTNMMETEFQAAFEELLFFVDIHYMNMGYGDFSDIPVSVTFDRDMIINQTELINTLTSSGVRISQRTLRKHHPLVEDVDQEAVWIKEEDEEAARINDIYYGAFDGFGSQTEGSEFEE